MFNKGKHAYSPKYARFIKWQGSSKAQGRRVRRSSSYLTDEKGDALEVSPGVFLPSRSEVRSRRRNRWGATRILGFLGSLRLLNLAASGIFAVRERLRSVRRAQESALLGYIPLRIFLGISVVTLGLYPYIWVWGNVYAFMKVCGPRVRGAVFRRFAVVGFCTQLMIPLAVCSCLWGAATGSEQAYELAARALLFFAVSYFAIIGPMRCSCYFDLRWNLRSAVAMWDRNSVMIDRTMTSWFKLFILGSVYIQFHINRLMGLGMPGFADAEEISAEFSLGEWIREYLRPKSRDLHAGDDDYGGYDEYAERETADDAGDGGGPGEDG
jgi:hypothetical protein